MITFKRLTTPKPSEYTSINQNVNEASPTNIGASKRNFGFLKKIFYLGKNGNGPKRQESQTSTGTTSSYLSSTYSGGSDVDGSGGGGVGGGGDRGAVVRGQQNASDFLLNFEEKQMLIPPVAQRSNSNSSDSYNSNNSYDSGRFIVYSSGVNSGSSNYNNSSKMSRPNNNRNRDSNTNSGNCLLYFQKKLFQFHKLKFN